LGMVTNTNEDTEPHVQQSFVGRVGKLAWSCKKLC